MLHVAKEINKGIIFIRLEGDLNKNNFYKLTETINYLLYDQGVIAYVLNLENINILDHYLISILQNKLTEIFLSFGSVALCGVSKNLQKKIGKRASELFYITEEKEVFQYISM